MFDVGFGELALVAVVALLVFGPEKMPELARQVGKFVGGARRVLDDIKSEVINTTDTVASAADEQPVVKQAIEKQAQNNPK